METTVRMIIIANMIHLTGSFQINSSVNATDFLEGSNVEMGCAFPVDAKFYRIKWENVKYGITLRCRTLTTCQENSKFSVSRNGYNTTLIIKDVKTNQNRWSCSDNTGSYIEFVTFNVIKNPPLSLLISKSSKFIGMWNITTSCSNPVPDVKCVSKGKEILPIMVSIGRCTIPLLYYKVIHLPQSAFLVSCQAFRGNESVHKSAETITDLKIEKFASCIYRIATPCTTIAYHIECFNDGKPMDAQTEYDHCGHGVSVRYHVDLKNMAYDSILSCNISVKKHTYILKEVISCHFEYYAIGGFLVVIGLMCVGTAVITYLFKIVKIKYAIYWKFVLWYFGILLVDAGILFFLWTINWKFVSIVFLPFFVLFLCKNIAVLYFGLYLRENRGLINMHSPKASDRTRISTPTEPPVQTPLQLAPNSTTTTPTKTEEQHQP